MRKLRTYMIVGVVTLLPVVATFFSLRWFFWFMDNLMRELVPLTVREHLPSGAGLILGLIVLALTGVAVTHLGGKYVVKHAEDILHRLPVVRSFYGAARSITDALLGTSSRAFQKAVLIEYPTADTYTLAFITSSTENTCNVFVPTTPNPTSGWFLVVPRHRVVELELVAVDDAIKMIMSGGVIQPDGAGQAELEAAIAKLSRRGEKPLNGST